MTLCNTSCKDIIEDYLSDYLDADELANVMAKGEAYCLNLIQKHYGAKVMRVRNKWVILD